MCVGRRGEPARRLEGEECGGFRFAQFDGERHKVGITDADGDGAEIVEEGVERGIVIG